MESSPDTASTSNCGWMIKLCVYADAEAVARALAASIISTFKHAAARSSPSGLMLAGGRTPKRAYQLVAESGAVIPPSLHVLISDERYVPPGHPDSNAVMLQPFLQAVHCPPEQQILVNTTLPRKQAAEDFGRRLGNFFDGGGNLDVCFLGLGADGHTASLFNPDHQKESTGKNAIDVDRPDGRAGISATPGIIRRANKIVFVVTGADKKEMAGKLLRASQSITAGQVVHLHPRVELWVDQAARPGSI